MTVSITSHFDVLRGTLYSVAVSSLSTFLKGLVSSVTNHALICNCAQSRKGEEGNSCASSIILLGAVVTEE